VPALQRPFRPVSVVPRLQIRGNAAEETDRLRQWWSRLSDGARDAFLADADSLIPDDHLEEVMAGGIRVIGSQRGDAGNAGRKGRRRLGT
jgi:hypothetical protein